MHYIHEDIGVVQQYHHSITVSVLLETAICILIMLKSSQQKVYSEMHMQMYDDVRLLTYKSFVLCMCKPVAANYTVSYNDFNHVRTLSENIYSTCPSSSFRVVVLKVNWVH